MYRPATTPSEIAYNCQRMGKDAISLAVALARVCPVAGHRWRNLCVWCAERIHPDADCYRAAWGSDGPCQACHYVGVDTVVVLAPIAGYVVATCHEGAAMCVRYAGPDDLPDEVHADHGPARAMAMDLAASRGMDVYDFATEGAIL